MTYLKDALTLITAALLIWFVIILAGNSLDRELDYRDRIGAQYQAMINECHYLQSVNDNPVMQCTLSTTKN
jgi:TM2 domain-containing membrane protein YozV